MSGEVKVEPAELDAKAAEIGEPMPQAPGEPLPPCALEVAVKAVGELNKSAEVMRGYAASGEAEAVRLAESFRSAATAYRQVDEQAGGALGNSANPPPISPVTPAPPTSPQVPLPPSPFYQCHEPPLVLLELAAAQIEAPDQAASLDTFATQWTNYASALDERSDAFDSNGMLWDGGAAEAAFTSLAKHRRWLEDMAAASRELAKQAGDLAADHRTAAAEHPTLHEVIELDKKIMAAQDPAEQEALMKDRTILQERSEEVLGKYAGQGIGSPLDPPRPPNSEPLPPASPNDTQRKGTGWWGEEDDADRPNSPRTDTPGKGAGGPSGPGGSTPPGGPKPEDAPMPQPDAPVSPAAAQGKGSGGGAPSGGAPSGGGGSPAGGGSGGGMPSLPELGGGSPTEMPPLEEPELSPAGAGGGSGGGSGGGAGGGGAGPMPLQPNVGGVSVGPGGAAGPTAVPAAASGAGGGGAMGGGMGGGMPMHGAGQGQGGARDRSRSASTAPDENLYDEDRPWTEAVIGNRPRRKDVTDGKDAT